MSLNNYQIKVLAATLMLIDHVGFLFFPDLFVLRLIGRFSLPLFILLLVDGEKYTRNFSRYCVRLLILAIVSQPIFRMLVATNDGNILFTLLLGLMGLRLVSVFPRWQLLIWCVGAAIAQGVNLEYGAYGIIAIALIRNLAMSYLWWMGWIALHLSLLLLSPDTAIFQFPAILAPLVLHLANHQAGPKARWFYLFYPVHLLVLWLFHLRLS